jgi:hypothetical protein
VTFSIAGSVAGRNIRIKSQQNCAKEASQSLACQWGRFSGAGFNGCCMALIDPGYREETPDGRVMEWVCSVFYF